MGLFKDDDGKGYLLTEDVRIHSVCVTPWSLRKLTIDSQRKYGLRIVALSDDFTSPTTDVFSWKLEGGNRVEAPAMLKLGKTYFMFASMMTGWDANENQYTTATSLKGPWSGWKKFADSGSKVLLSVMLFLSLRFSLVVFPNLSSSFPSCEKFLRTSFFPLNRCAYASIEKKKLEIFHLNQH
jgi:hypothetical protein